MRLVQDVLFLDCAEFLIPQADARKYLGTSSCVEVAVSRALAHVGLELIDYDTATWLPTVAGPLKVSVHSKAWRHKAEHASTAK
jgi:hypothetical protein